MTTNDKDRSAHDSQGGGGHTKLNNRDCCEPSKKSLRFPFRVLRKLGRTIPVPLTLAVMAFLIIAAAQNASGPRRVTGIIRDQAGHPVANVQVQIVGVYSRSGQFQETDAEGKFELELNSMSFSQPDRVLTLLARDTRKNLAVAQDLDEEQTTNLDLRLEPALTISGSAQCDGKPVTNAAATLVFWTGNMGIHLANLANTNVSGKFEIPSLPQDRRYGLYVSAPGFGQKYINLGSIEPDEQSRVVVEPVDLPPANQVLAGKVVDESDNPVANVMVQINGEGQPNASTNTDSEGQFRFDAVCEGSIRLYAFPRSGGGSGSTVAAGGDTNVVLRMGENLGSSSQVTIRNLSGKVIDPDGKPVGGARIAVFPGTSSSARSTAEGTFKLRFSLQSWQLQSGEPSLVVRVPDRNLAAIEEIPEDMTNITVQLEPGLTIRGRVEKPDGSPIARSHVNVLLLAGNTYSEIEQNADRLVNSTFEFTALPAGSRYLVFAYADGFSRSQREVALDAETNVLELSPFVLRPANHIIAGQVLSPDEKPAAGVNVSLNGNDQPQASTTTDSKGRFSLKVCEGDVRLFASGQSGFADTFATADDTNVVIQLNSSSSSSQPVPQRRSLRGSPLPDLTPFGITNAASGKALLLLLLDGEQRPSRRMARLLADQHSALSQKGVAVLGLQTTPASREVLRDWMASNPLPFAIGSIPTNAPNAKWATLVESLPWLILRDSKGTVVVEGFPIEELDTKLQGLK